jgi:hypothetical protein
VAPPPAVRRAPDGRLVPCRTSAVPAVREHPIRSAPSGAAAANAGCIAARDHDSWKGEWAAAGERVEAEARAALSAFRGAVAVVEPSVTLAGILSALLLLDAGHRLQETGIAPDDLGVRRRTLDEVFLSLIGNPAQDRAGPPETEAAQ